MKTSKAYRGQKLPKPTERGDVRPEIGGKRFTVGNVRVDSEGEMLRRRAQLWDILDRQCEPSTRRNG